MELLTGNWSLSAELRIPAITKMQVSAFHMYVHLCTCMYMYVYAWYSPIIHSLENAQCGNSIEGIKPAL